MPSLIEPLWTKYMDTDENKTGTGPALLELKVQSLNFWDISSQLHEELNHTLPVIFLRLSHSISTLVIKDTK